MLISICFLKFLQLFDDDKNPPGYGEQGALQPSVEESALVMN